MTLVEIMVVLTIIALTASFIGVAVFEQLKKAEMKAAKTQISQIAAALDLYKLEYRKYPSAGEGLQALTTPSGKSAPVMDSMPLDPWQKDYVYVYPGTHNPNGFDLFSYGPDGGSGGGDDIGNWASETP